MESILAQSHSRSTPVNSDYRGNHQKVPVGDDGTDLRVAQNVARPVVRLDPSTPQVEVGHIGDPSGQESVPENQERGLELLLQTR